MPYNFVVSVHFLYTGNYFVVVMKTFIVTRSPLELWVGEGAGGSLTSVPRGTAWHWCLRTFHRVIHELLKD